MPHSKRTHAVFRSSGIFARARGREGALARMCVWLQWWFCRNWKHLRIKKWEVVRTRENLILRKFRFFFSFQDSSSQVCGHAKLKILDGFSCFVGVGSLLHGRMTQEISEIDQSNIFRRFTELSKLNVFTFAFNVYAKRIPFGASANIQLNLSPKGRHCINFNSAYFSHKLVAVNAKRHEAFKKNH